MAVSRKNFGFLLLLLVIVLGGGVALVVILKNKKTNDPMSKLTSAIVDEYETPQAGFPPSNGVVGTRIECQKWLRNPNKPWAYAGQFTKSRIATRESVSSRSGDKIIRNSYWIIGEEEEDLETLRGVRLQACMGKIPVIVFKMRPIDGLILSHEHSNWNYYKPESPIETWEEYDTLLTKYLKVLDGIPAIIILEPDLLMFAYDPKNNQHRWKNKQYEEEFLKRAKKVISKLRYSRVYVDAGNAAYLTASISTLDQMAISLLRLPGLRGFSLNTMHFVNQTYNEFAARHLYCRTGYHYVVDTSRNGGSFSRQPLSKVQKCLYDPPNVKKGQFPGWAWGSQRQIKAPRLKRWINQLGSSANDYKEPETVPKGRGKFSPISSRSRTTTKQTPSSQQDRNDPNWAVNQYNNRINSMKNNFAGNQNNNHPAATNHNSQTSNNPFPNYNRNSNPQKNKKSNPTRRVSYKGLNSHRQTTAETPNFEPDTNLGINYKSNGDVRSSKVAEEYLQSFKSKIRSCMARKSHLTAHDANVWIKTPGESDGRMYRYGIFRKCLIDHSIPCDDACKMFVQADLDRDRSCQCGESESGLNGNTAGTSFLNQFSLK